MGPMVGYMGDTQSQPLETYSTVIRLIPVESIDNP